MVEQWRKTKFFNALREYLCFVGEVTCRLIQLKALLKCNNLGANASGKAAPVG
jgi:hypothetical protein